MSLQSELVAFILSVYKGMAHKLSLLSMCSMKCYCFRGQQFSASQKQSKAVQHQLFWLHVGIDSVRCLDLGYWYVNCASWSYTCSLTCFSNTCSTLITVACFSWGQLRIRCTACFMSGSTCDSPLRCGWTFACSLQLFCHAYVDHLVSSIQNDGIRNKRGPVGLGNTAFEGLDFLK